MKLGFILVISCIWFSCSFSESVSPDCIDAKLRDYNMVEYEGQDLGCKSFLVLYRLNSVQYFKYDNNCADIAYTYVSCEGDTLYSEWPAFEKESNRVGIVGITP